MVGSALSIPLLRGWLGRRDTLLPWGPREGPNSSEFFLLQKFFASCQLLVLSTFGLWLNWVLYGLEGNQKKL